MAVASKELVIVGLEQTIATLNQYVVEDEQELLPL